MGGRRRLYLAGAAAVLAATTALIFAGGGRAAHRFGPYADINAGHEAAFEGGHGDEADRMGADNPAAELVADRAYPRSYVDDRLARAGRRAFDRIPTTATSSWRALGPVTP